MHENAYAHSAKMQFTDPKREKEREREKTIKTKAQINNKKQAKGEPRMNDGMME